MMLLIITDAKYVEINLKQNMGNTIILIEKIIGKVDSYDKAVAIKEQVEGGE